jgi:hypothetical protein
MMKHTITIVALSVALIVLGGPDAAAQSTFADIEIGYQWVDIDGNEDLYRTQINQDDGFVVRNFSLNFTDSSGDASVADNLRIDASGFGGSPTGRLRLSAGKGGVYRLRLSYQQLNNFSALPAVANPLLDSGVVPGQHLWDRDRDILDIQLEFPVHPNLTPIAGYRRNTYDGPRRTTYHVGQDEFRLASDLEETEQEYYVGLNFQTERWWGTVSQGWRDFSGRETLGLAPGEGGGNSPRPVLGVDVGLDDFDRTTTTDAETPVTTAAVRGALGDKVRVMASYVLADAESETSLTEQAAGSLVSFGLSRFFSGLEQSVASRTENPSWRGEARVEVDFTSKLRLDVGYEARNRELDGWALISTMFLDTMSFGGLDTGDIDTLVDARTAYEREESIVNARLNVRDLGPFVLWAEGAVAEQDLDLAGGTWQPVFAFDRRDEYDRRISSFGLGAAVIFNGGRFSLDVASDSADNTIVRTDFENRDRVRARLDWNGIEWFRVLLTGELIERTNSYTRYDADTEHYALDLGFMPWDWLTFRLAADSYTTESAIPVRVPHDFSIELSRHLEEGVLYEAGVLLNFKRFHADLGYSNFENTGSFELDTTRGFARLGFDATDSFGIILELESNEYTEKVLTLADFDAARYGVFIRWRN